MFAPEIKSIILPRLLEAPFNKNPNVFEEFIKFPVKVPPPAIVNYPTVIFAF
jgi:hypothetical protein